jgi:hypothetical protein
MRILTIISIAICLMTTGSVQAQVPTDFQEAERKSLALYLKGSWPELLDFGRLALTNGQDYLNLRLRMGYAAFMMGHYAEAIRQYEFALGFDSYNVTAHEFLYFSRKYLGQSDVGAFHAPYLSAATRNAEGLDRPVLTEAGVEFSRKLTDVVDRGDHSYGHVTGTLRFGPRVQMQQMISGFGQPINESLLATATGSASIRVNQTGLYNKTRINIARNRQLIGAVHYLSTSFGPLQYQNLLAMAGFKWYGYQVNIQADAMFGRMTDTAMQQANLTMQYLPKGNMDLYGITLLSIHHRTKTGVNLRQVLGAKILDNTWLEGHATIGSFRNFAENDGLYIYNSIDEDRMKSGLTAYRLMKGGILLQAGYTLEQRSRFGRNETYLQHSITGGISWRK